MRALPVLLVTVLTAALATPVSAAVGDDTRYVDPLIGSAGGGNTYPGAVRPFGMISWSPTSTRGDQTGTGAANEYAYDATRVRGFSLTHVNGAGCHPGAAGDVPIMPHVGEITSSPTADTRDQIFASDFSHADEKAEAGRYRVGLKSGATADLSVTTRAGIGEFTFPVSGSLLFRTSNSLNGSEDADITIDPATSSVSGSVLTGAFCGRRANGGANNQKTYYRLRPRHDVRLYVFAALGLYPRTPSSAELHLSSPMFPRARITKKNITVLATGTPGVHVRETRWNGREVERPWLPEAFVERGGVLVSRLEG
ncbi:glycoside hydrolase domain-containing protein [Lentzea jiangxiensis]|uniref:Glycosyl hydrolase family 92 n=1 Tax=Lentzea jiangxiensis TaxID=641025 RepID=A0A1H0IXV1_9PSEU|nr:glycoside hydrolase domain-containing protein [Lentzea jiangxiensis]SDO36142.1 Glycosyl hydrolase family 92 [Lentzea jiangxiensis]